MKNIIKWMMHDGHYGWHKCVNGNWDFCGQGYQPTVDDVIDGMDS